MMSEFSDIPDCLSQTSYVHASQISANGQQSIKSGVGLSEDGADSELEQSMIYATDCSSMCASAMDDLPPPPVKGPSKSSCASDMLYDDDEDLDEILKSHLSFHDEPRSHFDDLREKYLSG